MRDRLIKFGTTPVLLAISIMLAWPALYGGSVLGTHVRLLINLASYRQIIAEARTGTLEPGIYHTSENGIHYIVDNGPPVRVAFNPDGLLDNWSGIIFDPTGIVMSAKGFHPVTGAFYAPERVTKLFGGDLVSCHSLWGDFYHCSFT
ncbi:hypothetical protein [Sphingomonas sp. C3-2]|uniref:hypothetical protein n=1 Tax=Sphingomonas sp. C3-2 TaxID=3062169 RepID=UPI00294B85EE|nr:hypothetical protein [Sphingomonas sp. C3-2]WOK36298.1 hypothetical protein QYC26_15025 [Sphingomonas sp. C3-2]